MCQRLIVKFTYKDPPIILQLKNDDNHKNEENYVMILMTGAANSLKFLTYSKVGL